LAEVRDQIHQTSNGGFMRERDSWRTLISDTDTGARSVEHEWSYVDPFGQEDIGFSSETVEHFLAGGADCSVKQKLRAILGA
jgi:hypothetical protein